MSTIIFKNSRPPVCSLPEICPGTALVGNHGSVDTPQWSLTWLGKRAIFSYLGITNKNICLCVSAIALESILKKMLHTGSYAKKSWLSLIVGNHFKMVSILNISRMM